MLKVRREETIATLSFCVCVKNNQNIGKVPINSKGLPTEVIFIPVTKDFNFYMLLYHSALTIYLVSTSATEQKGLWWKAGRRWGAGETEQKHCEFRLCNLEKSNVMLNLQ